MAGIIKNQILKHLSKFAKNLSSNSINVNTLRGEGELCNLELNEKVLTDLLELPNWMQISQASVNKVSIKIQWTKLKTTPIHLTMDEVYVQMETCQDLRPHGAPSDLGAAYRSGSKYGFVEKVIDGMTVTVDSVYVRFNSPAFTTTFHLTRLTLSSKSPSWKHTDLRLTRLKDLNQQHILIFKELLWQTLKIESKSTNPNMTPIRLITNQSCCRITVKKKLSDCSVVGCRLVLISEDILWVLTDSQILSAYHLVESLSGLIKKSTEQSQKSKAARKLESIPAYYSNPLHSYGTSAPNGSQDKEKSGLWNSGYSQAPSHIDQASMHKFQIFKKFDVVETSYHFYSEKIDLHFCDDPGTGRSSYPDLGKGGTLQVNIMKIKLDYYPYHLALGDRTHWIKYQEGCPYQWTKASLNNFRNSLYDFFNSKHTSHTPLGRASPHTSHSNQTQNTKENGNGITDNSQPTKAFISNQFKRLMSTCFLLTCKNLVVYKVALSKRKCTQIEMLTSDKTRLCLPEGTSFVHMEFSSYYYPGGLNFPVPPPKIYTYISPFKLDVDLMSLLWLNAFAINLKEKTLKSTPTPPYIDVYTEVLMPRIIVKPIKRSERQKGRPRAMQILTSRLVVSNVRSPDPTDPGSKAKLFSCLEEAQKGPLFFASGFPSRKGDRQPIPSKFLWHAEGSDIICRPIEATPPDEGYSPAALWTEPRDVLFFHCDPVWVEYLEKFGDEHRQHPLPFLDPFPISIWIHIKELSFPPLDVINDSCSGSASDVRDVVVNGSCSSIYSGENKKEMEATNEASFHGLIYIPNLVSLQVSHLQFLFLMRILDAVDEFSTFLTEDTNRIQSKQESILIAAIFPLVSASLILPPCFPIGLGITSPVECSEFQQIPSSLGPLKDLTSGGTEEVKSILSKSSVPSLSPPNDFSPPEGPVEIGEEGEGRLAKSQSDSCLTSALEFPSVNISRSGEVLNNPAIRSVTPQIVRPEADRKHSSSTSISLSSSVRRGLTSGLHTLKNTLESSVGSKLPPNDDASDTTSIHSDLSNDSDTFVMLYIDNDHDTNCSFTKTDLKGDVRSQLEELEIETGTEVIEDQTEDPISSSDPSEASTATKAKQYIGVITFKIGDGQLILESEGHNSFIKFQASSIDHEEFPRITMEDFQKKFHHNKSNGVNAMGMKPCSIRVRINTEGVLKVTDGKQEEQLPCYLEGRYTCHLPVHRNSTMEADVMGLSMSLYMSSLMELLDFIEEEIVPLPMPMKIKLEKIDVDVVDLKSKLSKNSQKYLIPRMLIERDEASVFTLLPVPCKESVTNLSISSSSSLAPVPSFSDPSLTSGGNPTPIMNSVPNSVQIHEKCHQREEDLTKELDRLKEQLASCQRENMNLMKALTILHEDRNVRK